jgi:hypothetical protein
MAFMRFMVDARDMPGITDMPGLKARPPACRFVLLRAPSC